MSSVEVTFPQAAYQFVPFPYPSLSLSVSPSILAGCMS